MRIAIQTWGSTGDIRPMLALASGLKRAGHRVEIVVTSLDNRSYAADCQQIGIAYRQIPAVVDLDLQEFAQRTFRMNGMQWLRALLQGGFFPYQQAIYEAACELAVRNDVVVGHHFLFPLKLAARQAGKPHVSVTLCHGAIVSAQKPPFRMPDLGKFLNHWQWRLFNGVFDLYLKRELGQLWRQHEQAISRSLFDELLSSDTLDLVAVDPVFCADAHTWNPVHRNVGFFNHEDDTRAWQLPPELDAFINAGAAPIYCSFGSLQHAVPEWAMDLFITAVSRVGCRAIIQSSSTRFPEFLRQDGCLFVARHPHQPVFERCAAVIHHGGAGTTHAATRAGCPSVVVPFMDEQLFWGQQLQLLGVGTAPLHAKRATPEALARRLEAILTDPGYRLRAQTLRESLLATDGVARAITLIEKLVD